MSYQWRGTSVGDEIDSVCTRCKEETIHRVVAIVEGRPHVVICTRCWGQHRYRPSPEAKKKGVPLPTKRQTKGRANAKTSQFPQPNEPLEEWLNLRGNAVDLQPLPYDQSTAYRIGQAVMHPIYGLGFVSEVIGSTKIEIIFQREVKVLVMNRVKSTQA